MRLHHHRHSRSALEARRNREDAEIVVYERDGDISYSGCGMPYHLVARWRMQRCSRPATRRFSAAATMWIS